MVANINFNKNVVGTPVLNSAGDTVTYSFSIENEGPDTIVDLQLTDTILGGVVSLDLLDAVRRALSCWPVTMATISWRWARPGRSPKRPGPTSSPMPSPRRTWTAMERLSRIQSARRTFRVKSTMKP